ncbi:MAG TPA: TonB family protein, partial [Pyrinomonadaceae bacterium]|nr:TonB family protein [Pyrinomonadaceae bacterium]
VSFGNPYLLKNFPEFKTFVVSYGDMTSLQRATVRAVLGEIDFKGKLPITISPEYPRGTGLNILPKALSAPKPPYPPLARFKKAAGDVRVEVSVDENGKVVESKVLDGNELLREVAGEWARQWKFEKPNKPETVKLVLTFRFLLKPTQEDFRMTFSPPYTVNVFNDF